MITDILNGYNATLMAYGQTGSGKTHSIFGTRESIDQIGQPTPENGIHADLGVVPRLVDALFEYINENPRKS